jgi:chorismate mutase
MSREENRVVDAGHDSTAQSNIDELRRALDAIDGAIVELLAERRSTVSAIASAKDRDALGVRDLVRERHVLAQAEVAAVRLGVSRDLVRSIFTAILEDSVAFQTELISSPVSSRPARAVHPPS